jgi:hypothetical protein
MPLSDCWGWILVTISGTWTREKTLRSQVRVQRKVLQEAARRIGAELKVTCNRVPPKPGALAGTFRFKVRLAADGWNSAVTAKKLLEALLYSNLCKPPRIKVIEWEESDPKYGLAEIAL